VPEIVSTAEAILAGRKVARRILVPSVLVDRSNVERFPNAF
jgi:hypothetical protein